MDLRTAGKQKFFRIEIAARGGYAMGIFPIDGKLGRVIMIHKHADGDDITNFSMKVGNNEYPKDIFLKQYNLSADPNSKPELKQTEYKFKKYDKFEFIDLGSSIKEVILYVE